ncbi:RNA polymerase, sigma 54 subunit, RpoN/SigL [Thermoanaerobacter thermohydrosulfuricus]|uniref:RNA polymerase, sigma 54 subunit, RpoN n=5 Tax=Thermoanaerobacter TaxID=1754 RepID=B0K876_THEP3|nr:MULTISPECIES: RNA polymerase factor sigma-54 [Thermoanaerobacter]EGD51848.1 RNA polymerase, sigma 54 subunit, RpoN [Thermoanaerobacter ethanolicus JW 200]ABY94389.1 RNA polymerase, sigma 54 subunit, RpoN [Thermoanaerobacter pseudethanolicus ATCC 33223]ADV79342.1 RNA polymerase sigma-54 factor, RpoN [Thermoanaerobacter brockii subsp. finnii Ako-1]AEM79091.1 RNA polymerase, sigma 54 subunit, RpoN [Thermoanaerobacter wiegelii Rt8.B1]EMT38484.1 RNA polymerase sigma-54 factor [Thermoanaerobacter
MRMEFDLKLQQTQKLIMTPELKQAIEILQLNSLELNALIEQELETNPLLEKEEVIEEDIYESNDFTELAKYIRETEERMYYDDSDDEEIEEVNYENFVSTKPSLTDHLLFQLHITPVSPKIQKICEYIIFSLSPSGYLREDIKDIAEILECTEEEVLEGLSIVQSFDPPGIAARNLQECLKLQLLAQDSYKGIVKELVDYHLEEIAEGKYSYLAKLYNISLKEVQQAVDFIKKLNPKPGSSFSSTADVRYIVPDVEVIKREGEYFVIVNDSVTPKLKINNYYHSILNSHDEEAKKYINSKLQSAMWLIKSLESRKETLYKVVKAIVELQRDFLDKGINYLKPMTQKQIADIVGIHESTVSRAINGKYVATPRGLFELKFFFQSGISNKNGNEFSAETIKNLIKKLIEEEDPTNPLSDQKIADILKEKNINISRRTVAKYREECNIPSTIKRRRY